MHIHNLVFDLHSINEDELRIVSGTGVQTWGQR